MAHKPDSNRLLLYLFRTVSNKTDHPYTMYIDPFIQQLQLSPEEAFNKCRISMKELYSDLNMHYTGDAAFN
jgi:hypothetical protein